MKEVVFSQYKVPHCNHCKCYHDFTGNCLLILQGAMKRGSKGTVKAHGSRTCKSFEPKEQYKKNYKSYERLKENEDER